MRNNCLYHLISRTLPISLMITALSACVIFSPPKDHTSLLPQPPETWVSKSRDGNKSEQDKNAFQAPETKGKVTPRWFSQNDQELDELVREALEKNPEIMAAVALLNQQRAEVAQKNAAFFPSLDFLSGASRTKSSAKDLDGKRIKSYDNNFRVEAKVSWEIDVWGRLRSASSASQSDLAQRELDLKNARLSIATRVALQWIELIALTQQVEISRNQTRTLAQIVERTTSRYKAGLANILDLRLVETDLANAMATLSGKEDQRAQAARKLEIILGRYPSALIKTRDTLPKLTEDFSTGVPSNLLKNRPDILSAEEKIVAANYRTKEAEADRLPSLSLSQSTAYQNGKIKDLFDPVSLIASIAGNVIQPVFDGGRRAAIAEQHRAISDERVADYLAIVLKAYREVEDNLTSDVLLTKQEKQLSKASRDAAESERLSREKYFNGLISTLDLLEAQQRYFITKSRLVNIQKQRLQTRATLHLALGGQNIPLPPTRPEMTSVPALLSVSNPVQQAQTSTGISTEEQTGGD